MPKLTQFIQGIRSGSSLPLIMSAENQQKYVVKPIGAGDGVIGSITEFIVPALADTLGIPVMKPLLVDLESGLGGNTGDQEIDDLLESSIGVNVATILVEPVGPFRIDDSPKLAAELRGDIFLLDLLLLNIDRNPGNPNMFFEAGQLRCFDYGSSLTVRGFLEERSYESVEVVRKLKSHIFYSADVDPRPFLARLANLDVGRIHAHVNEIPVQWIRKLTETTSPEHFRATFLKKLLGLQQSRKKLVGRLDLLKALQEDTPGARQARAKKNREIFEQKYGKF